MSETQYRITNLRSQPVELHLSESVLILAPHQQADIPAADLATPQLSTLIQRRLVNLQEVTPAPHTQDPNHKEEET